jgi:predicted amidohydrolase
MFGMRHSHRIGSIIGSIIGSLVLAVSVSAAPKGGSVAHYTAFETKPAGWTSWSPRPEIAPVFRVDPHAGRTGQGALEIRGGGNSAAVGSWRRRIDGVVGGKTYHFSAFYRVQGVDRPQQSITARLVWLDAQGRQARPPDYVLEHGDDAGWTRLRHITPAPEGASSVSVELGLTWAGDGTVWFDDVRLDEEPSAAQRLVRTATVYHRPSGTGSAAASVEQFCKIVEANAGQRPDIVCLPEGISVIGTGKSYAEVSESVPGPSTERLGALARRLRCYIVGGIYERSGSLIYNTAVLLDRGGRLVGKYRKTHLPREEVEAGLTPGSEYPVFDTDFGKVGLMICWDLQFPEPARALALQGAELILLPIWGGSDVLARARAIENHVYLVTSSYDMKTFIVAPNGDIAAEAGKDRPFAIAEVALDRQIFQPWLGDMKARTWKERRPDLAIPPAPRKR